MEEISRPPARIFVPSCGVRVSRVPAVLYTVLGSCVSVCIFDPSGPLGGMNHFLLNEAPCDSSLDLTETGKYANLSVPYLVRALERIGANRDRLVAKVAGGARILKFSPYGDVASKNVEAARQQLRDLGIAVVSEDVGGTRGRKIEFNTETGHLVVNEDRIL